MKHNPYNDLIKVVDKRIKKSIPQFGDLGTLISIHPLKIEFNGIIIDSNVFYIDTMNNNCKIGDKVLVIPNKEMTRFFILGAMIYG